MNPTLRKHLKAAAAPSRFLARKVTIATLSLIRAFAPLRRALRLSSNHIVAPATVGTYTEIDFPTQVHLPLPDFPGRSTPHPFFADRHTYTTDPCGVYSLSQVRFWGFFGGSFFTADDHLIDELSPDVYGPRYHTCYTCLALPRAITLPGKTLVVISSQATANYAHWLIELMPRFRLVLEAGYTWEDFDHILIKARMWDSQRECLRMLGIPDKKIRLVGDRDMLHLEHAIIPSHRRVSDNVHPKDVDFLRRILIPHVPVANPRFKRIYVARDDASFRYPEPKTEIEAILAKHGFTKITATAQDFRTTLGAFAHAELIFSLNGSQLQSVVVASLRTHIIEAFAPRWIGGWDWVPSAMIGCPYTVLIGGGHNDSPPWNTGIRDNVALDPVKLDELLTSLTSART